VPWLGRALLGSVPGKKVPRLRATAKKTTSRINPAQTVSVLPDISYLMWRPLFLVSIKRGCGRCLYYTTLLCKKQVRQAGACNQAPGGGCCLLYFLLFRFGECFGDAVFAGDFRFHLVIIAIRTEILIWVCTGVVALTHGY
jgi:hypothetical protein